MCGQLTNIQIAQRSVLSCARIIIMIPLSFKVYELRDTGIFMEVKKIGFL